MLPVNGASSFSTAPSAAAPTCTIPDGLDTLQVHGAPGISTLLLIAAPPAHNFCLPLDKRPPATHFRFHLMHDLLRRLNEGCACLLMNGLNHHLCYNFSLPSNA